MAKVKYTSLADRYALAKAELEKVEKQVQELRKGILETGKSEIVGRLCTVTVGTSDRTSIDRALLANFITPDQLERCTKHTPCDVLRIKPVPLSIAA